MKRTWIAVTALTTGVLVVATLATRRPSIVVASPGGRAVSAESKDPGLAFRLSEGVEGGGAYERAPLAAAQPLGEAETKRLLDRLPPVAAQGADQVDFALRESSLPPPRTGATVHEPFPPSAPAQPAPDTGASGPLQVLRQLPSGDVPLAPHVSLTFSQPMVSVTSQAEAEKVQPAELHPLPPGGRWRWVGTKTLLFELEPRLPMATEYTLTVPAGTRSATGTALAKAAAFTFRTPPPRLRERWPAEGSPARRDTLMFASFDQRVEPQAVLATLQVRAGQRGVRVRLATPEEIAADEQVRGLARAAEPGRFLVVRADEPLPADAPIRVAFAAGTPSAEGPRRTAEEQSWSFRTYGPLKVTESRCGWSDECRPFMPWRVEFSNPLDARAFRREMVRVEPAVPGLKVSVHGNALSIQGATRGRTTYRVTLLPEVPDTFGQTLGSAQALTFTVGPAEPWLTWTGGNLTVLDPAARPALSVYTVNVPELRVQAWSVKPADWPGYAAQMGRRWEKGATPPGRSVLSTVVRVKGQADELTETRVDLGSVFPTGLGHAVLRVEPTTQPKDEWRRLGMQTWVQATRIGLSAAVDARELLGWASDLATGQPLVGVELSLGPGGPSATTGADGLARVALPAQGARGAWLVAHQGQDSALLPHNVNWWNANSGWQGGQPQDRLLWYVADDRGLYRPGEKVSVKGWLRRLQSGPQGDVGLFEPAPSEIAWTLRDSRNNEVAKGHAALNALGGFDLKVDLPATMNLGAAQLTLASGAGMAFANHTHAFQVQEFRRPEFEVAAQASEGPHVVGQPSTVTLSAAYYAGGALPGAAVSWNVRARAGSYRPPNHDDFVFGVFEPWWLRFRPEAPERSQAFTSRTDGSGRHVLRLDFDAVEPARPTHLTAEGTVTDVNRQAWTASASLVVHPAALYVGLRSPRLFVQQGEPLVVDAVVTDIDGRRVPGRPIELRAERLDWQQVEGEYEEVVAGREDCALTSGAEPLSCRFGTKEGGSYRVTARILDDRDRPNESVLRLWVAGGRQPQRRDVDKEEVQLIPSKKEYQPGETAEILVLSPFAPAQGLLTLRREGLLRSERFSLAGNSHTLRIPIEEGFTPNLHVQVDLAGAADRAGAGKAAGAVPQRPAFASGTIELSIPPVTRTLKLSVEPRQARLEPGGATSLDVTLRDAQGRPVAGGEVAVIVADEAVLALTGYRLADPLAVFYPGRGPGVSDVYLREHVLLGRLEDLDLSSAAQDELASLGDAGAVPPPPAAAPSGMPMTRSKAMASQALSAEMVLEEAPATPIRARTDFSALALFAASLPTDGQGKAEVALKLPDNLTRYRVMAVGVAGGKQFGAGESSVQARLPLMVRPSPPRFLNFGDRFELGVVLQNQTDAALDVQVAVRATNAQLTAGAGRRLTVPANDRVEVRFPAAAQRAGTARFQVGVSAGRFADAAELSFPVWTPATTEAFATYGTLDQGAVVQPVQAPPHVVPQFGGLEVTTSSTALQSLTDAVLYLVAYPFECSEQLASRVLAVAALKDVLAAFEAEGLPPRDELLAAVDRDLARLRSLQNDDGSFGFWQRGDRPWPYLGVHVALALERARAKGFKVEGDTWSRSQSYLKSIERHIPSWYGEEARRTLIAYALFVRQRMGDADPARARKLVAEAGVEKLSFEALGWLLPVLAADKGSAAETAAIRKHLANRVEETAGAAHFVVAYGDSAHLLLHSDRRADAVLLEALIATDSKNDLIPKLVAGLLGHRQAGRWGNTQENVFVLLALDSYFNTYEKVTPDFVARLWLGERYAGEQAYRGRSTDRHLLTVPMAVLGSKPGAQPLVISKDGPGRLYYRIGLRYAPDSLKLDPADYGFTVTRRYEGVDAKDDVKRDADGTWRVKAGARVRVKLEMVAPARRYHVALVDPLPAGLEPLNPALATTGTLPKGEETDVAVMGAPGLGGPGRHGPSWWWWWRPWFEHQNLRDERVEAFSSLVWEGVYSYSYVARATTLGTFVVPPAKAEEMYAPETFGRTGTDRLVVE